MPAHELRLVEDPALDGFKPAAASAPPASEVPSPAAGGPADSAAPAAAPDRYVVKAATSTRCSGTT
jgi:hypothetical protein